MFEDCANVFEAYGVVDSILARCEKQGERLRAEIDAAFPAGEDTNVDYTKQGLMPYLNACM